MNWEIDGVPSFNSDKLLSTLPIIAFQRRTSLFSRIHLNDVHIAVRDAVLPLTSPSPYWRCVGVTIPLPPPWQGGVLPIELTHHIKGWGRVLETPCAYHLNCLVISHFALRYKAGLPYHLVPLKGFSSIIPVSRQTYYNCRLLTQPRIKSALHTSKSGYGNCL